MFLRLRIARQLAPPCVAMLIAASALAGARASAQDGAVTSHRIAGTVYDSIANAPLSRALVQLISRNDHAWVRSAFSDADGAFAFDSVPAGAYRIGFLHARQDSLHIAPQLRELMVPRTDSMVQLAIPSVAAIARAACRDTPLNDDEALFIGRLRPAVPSASASSGLVSVQWSEIFIGSGVDHGRPMIRAEVDGSGAFAICGVPVETPVLVQGVTEHGKTGVIELTAPASRVLLRDLLTAPVDSVRIGPIIDTVEARDTRGDDLAPDSITRLHGPGRMRGAIRAVGGTAIVGARVRVRESLAEAVTDSLGRFELHGLPLGTHAVEAIAVGYVPVRRAADISLSDTARLVVTMSPVDVTLDPVRVFGERRVPAWKRDFDARRRQGMGRFLDEAAIARRNPMLVTDLLVGLPGVRIQTGLFTSTSRLLMRDGTGGYCVPEVVVDGILVEISDLGVDSFVMASQLVGVELYRSNILRPMEFPRRRSCGLIVLWTGNRQQPQR